MTTSRMSIIRGRPIFALAGANLAGVTLALSAVATGGVAGAATRPASFLGHLHGVSKVASTVPPNGDVNPYGLAVVPTSEGQLVQGDSLVSNFNDKANVQGTGSTIVQVSPNGTTRLFSNLSTLPASMSCPGGVGLTTALGVLPGGWVVVGSLPTTTGGALPSLNPAGCLTVLDDQGTPVETITNTNIVGPWDMAVESNGSTVALFVSNALGDNTKTTPNGTPITGKCTVVRVDLTLGGARPPRDRHHRHRHRLPMASEQGGAGPRPDRTRPLGQRHPLRGRHGDQHRLGDPECRDPDNGGHGRGLHDLRRRRIAGAARHDRGAERRIVVVNGNNGNAVELSPKGRQLATKTLVKKGAGICSASPSIPRTAGSFRERRHQHPRPRSSLSHVVLLRHRRMVRGGGGEGGRWSAWKAASQS